MATASAKNHLVDAIKIVNAQYGDGASEKKSDLVSAIVVSLAMECLTKALIQQSEQLSDIIARSAAVAAGN